MHAVRHGARDPEIIMDITELAETDKISSKYGDEATPLPNNQSK